MTEDVQKAIEDLFSDERNRFELKFTEFNNYLKQSNEAIGLFENQIKVISDELKVFGRIGRNGKTYIPDI